MTLFSTFNRRLGLILTANFLFLCIFSSTILIHCAFAYQRQATQLLHKDLAGHIVDEYTFFEADTINLLKAKSVFHKLMILGPNFELYLLDDSGKILAYSTDPDNIKRQSVDVRQLEKLLAQSEFNEPILGEDPRSLANEKIFSAAKIDLGEGKFAYLYIILRSQMFDDIASSLWASHLLQWALWLLVSGILFGLMATLWLTGIITRPLKKLTQQVREVQHKGFGDNALAEPLSTEALSVWQANSMDEIHVLGAAFHQLLEKLNEQYQQVITIDELRKELLSHISHDLRTPLASLLGYLETWELQRHSISDEQSASYIAVAKKGAKQISSLLEQLFELAHLDGQNIHVAREYFPVAELVQDVLKKFEMIAKKKNIQLDVEPKDSRISVYGDIEKLDRVFTNLVENALRHTAENGKIVIRLKPDSQRVTIEVSDTGIGIPANDIPFIFDPHYKAGNSVRENTAHGGLGLAITKKLLDLHQSTIRVTSQIDVGTTFQFVLQSKLP